jgi:HPt (histidine-containing phosphotransfer) domain-containing protein
MTANAMAGDRDKALQAGMNDHVAKPIDLTELFAVLDRWMRIPEDRSIPTTSAAKTAIEQTLGLPDLPGIDTESGLARCGGKEALYRKILCKFRETQMAAPRRIQAALEAGARSTAEREAHTLKGVAGNIGAGEVQAAAKRLEAAIREEANPEGLITELDGMLCELGDALRSLMPAPDVAGAALIAGDTGDLLPQLDRLQGLLEDYDAAAGELVAEIESRAANTELAERVRALGDHIDDFEFDGALERLKDLRELVRS